MIDSNDLSQKMQTKPTFDAVKFSKFDVAILRIILFLIFCPLTLEAQVSRIPVETWRSHLTYHNARSVAVSETKIYTASENGLFSWDKNTQKISILDKSDGLSDVAFARLAYSETLQMLVIGYQNGNIDLIKNDELINIRTVFNSQFQDKQIYQVYLNNDKAYFSTGFGVTVLDLTTYQIVETYSQLGNEGAEISAFDCVIFQNKIYVATAEGLKSARLDNDVNRQDFRNWNIIFTNLDGNLRTVSADERQIYFGINGTGLYVWNGTNAILSPEIPAEDFVDISQSQGKITVCTLDKLFIFENEKVQIQENEKIKNPRQALFDSDGNLWLADYIYGLLHFDGKEYINYYPSEVYSSEVFGIYNFDTKILAVSGGYDAQIQAKNTENGFYVFADGIWENYNSEDNTANTIILPKFRDITASTYDAVREIYYFSSFGDGILIWNPSDNSFEILNTENTSIFPNNYITDIVLDFEGNLWITFYNVAENQFSILQRKTDGTWNGRFARTPSDRFPLGILVDLAGNVWVRLNPNLGGGILVWSPDNGEEIYLSSAQLSGNLPSSQVRCMHLDKEDNLWVGTDEGIRVFYSAFAIFEMENPEGQPVIYQLSEFLNNQKITAITSDGGNRKWIGTSNGVYLFDTDKSEIIAQFDEKNSPLLSDNVRSIAVQGNTGEVFFATEKGISSYQGTATESGRTHTNVRVFPNPVPPNFTGKIAIEGLVSGANVKITDMTGKLVYETYAEGGMAVWAGTNFSGSPRKTGVYLVYSSDDKGVETFVTKILWIESR